MHYTNGLEKLRHKTVAFLTQKILSHLWKDPFVSLHNLSTDSFVEMEHLQLLFDGRHMLGSIMSTLKVEAILWQ